MSIIKKAEGNVVHVRWSQNSFDVNDVILDTHATILGNQGTPIPAILSSVVANQPGKSALLIYNQIINQEWLTN